MHILVKTLGCKANRYESERIQDKFGDTCVIGDPQLSRMKHVDVILINTCTVTHVADRKSRQAISPLKSLYPNAKVIVFGCGANTDPKGYFKLKHVDYVVQKSDDLDKLLSKLNKRYQNRCESSDLRSSRMRSLIKIQDGCNNFCSYCIVPFARGREKSRPSDEIINEIKGKTKKGYKEAVLTGINIGMWKEDGDDLAALIERILNETTIERLRLSSIEPQNFSDRFIKLFENPRFCPHLHISLQSGSDTVLKLMRRRYNSAEFADLIERLKKAVPHISITTDVIVGFPGETEKLFKETVDFVQKMAFSKIHIFPYSKRKGTLAATMPEQLPYAIKKERAKKLAIIEQEMRREFHEKNTLRTDSVLIETVDKAGNAIGFTSNYLKTRIQKGVHEDKINTIVDVTLDKVNKDNSLSARLKT